MVVSLTSTSGSRGDSTGGAATGDEEGTIANGVYVSLLDNGYLSVCFSAFSLPRATNRSATQAPTLGQ